MMKWNVSRETFLQKESRSVYCDCETWFSEIYAELFTLAHWRFEK